jgi:uncharacterized membrane protein
MITLQTVHSLVDSILVVLPITITWHWMTMPRRHPERTFFGVRVESGFPRSLTAEAILNQFRWRIWTWALGIAVAWALIQAVSAAGSELPSYALCAVPMFGMLACTSAFGLAHGRTQRQAESAPEPTIRVATLATEEPDCVWLQVLDWAAMIVPPLIPVVTLIIISTYWNQFPSRFHEDSSAAANTAFTLALGLFSTANYWALLFRTRGGDWAFTPRTSHVYRSYLGMMQSCIFTFMICQLCVLSVMPLHSTVAWLRPLNIMTEMKIILPLTVGLAICCWIMRLWISKHLEKEKGDPMPDRFWKWGWFYYNPSDPVLVVPTRTGAGYSPNYARSSVWLACGTLIVLCIAAFVQMSYEERALDRQTQEIEREIQSTINRSCNSMHAKH